MTEQEFIDSAVKDQAARAMLAVLKRVMQLSLSAGDDELWMEVRGAIAQAKAAGIKGED